MGFFPRASKFSVLFILQGGVLLMFFSFYDLALLAVIIFAGFGSLPAVQSAAILVFSHLFSSLILLVFSSCKDKT